MSLSAVAQEDKQLEERQIWLRDGLKAWINYFQERLVNRSIKLRSGETVTVLFVTKNRDNDNFIDFEVSCPNCKIGSTWFCVRRKGAKGLQKRLRLACLPNICCCEEEMLVAKPKTATLLRLCSRFDAKPEVRTAHNHLSLVSSDDK